MAALSRPISLDFLGQEGERDVISISPRTPKFFNHSHRAVGVSSMNQNGGCPLKLWIQRQPSGDRVTSAFVVMRRGVVVFRQQVMVQEDCVKRVFAQHLTCFGDGLGDSQEVALKSFGEPFMASLIVVQKKDTNRVTVSAVAVES